MVQPQFVICDEPVSALDLSVQAQVLNLLRELQNDFDLTYLFIAHDLAVVRHLSHRIVVLYQGRVMEQGHAATVYAHPAHPYTRALLRAAPVPDPDLQRQQRLSRQEQALIAEHRESHAGELVSLCSALSPRGRHLPVTASGAGGNARRLARRLPPVA